MKYFSAVDKNESCAEYTPLDQKKIDLLLLELSF